MLLFQLFLLFSFFFHKMSTINLCTNYKKHKHAIIKFDWIRWWIYTLLRGKSTTTLHYALQCILRTCVYSLKLIIKNFHTLINVIKFCSETFLQSENNMRIITTDVTWFHLYAWKTSGLASSMHIWCLKLYYSGFKNWRVFFCHKKKFAYTRT